MCLGFNNWIKRVIFVLPLLLISNAALSDGTYYRINGWYNEDTQGRDEGGFDLSKCSDSSRFPINVQYGDPGAPRDDMIQDTTPNYIMFVYGKRWEKNKRSGIWKFAQGIEFKAPQQYRQPILSALKKALAQGNCIAAADLADGLANGQECFGDAYCFENTNDDGSKNQCYVKSNGENKCKISEGKTEETLPDGTPRIKIDCASGEDCRRETDLDGYADQTDKASPKAESGGKRELRGKEGDKGSNGGSSGGSSGGSGGGSNLGGSSGGSGKGSSGGSSGGSLGGSSGGSDDDNDNKGEGGNMGGKNGTGKGGSGTGTGSGGTGTGSGKGNGGGVAGNGKGDKDTSDVDFFEAPSMSEVFAPLQKLLKDKFSPNVEIGGGDCPKPTITLMGKSYNISAHCEILAAVRDYFSALMMFLYTFTAIRILLSA